jgi:hypothetical protein
VSDAASIDCGVFRGGAIRIDGVCLEFNVCRFEDVTLTANILQEQPYFYCCYFLRCALDAKVFDNITRFATNNLIEGWALPSPQS